MTMSGGCLCGAVRYEIEGEPSFVCKCYCSDCHKESGTGHLTVIAVPEEGTTISGETRSFVKLGDSGLKVTRQFCPACGTTLLARPEVMPGMLIVRTGTLDDSSELEVTMALFGGSSRHWDQPPAEMMTFPGMPPQG